MGFFDKLFKKKKQDRFRPPHNYESSGAPMVPRETSGTTPKQELPVKGPPRTEVSYKHLSAPHTGQVRGQSSLNQNVYTGQKGQHKIDESVKRVTRPVPTSVRRKGPPSEVPIRRPARQIPKKTKKIRHVMSATQLARDQATGTQTTKAVSPETKPLQAPEKLLEDTMGEEELFKKLAQWDKDLKRKPVSGKVGGQIGAVSQSPGASSTSMAAVGAKSAPGAAPAYTGPAGQAPPITPEELLKREQKLRALEAKLLERERQLVKKEELKSAFTELEDRELERITKVPGAKAGAVPANEIAVREAQIKHREEELARREKELQKALKAKAEPEESEEYYQPLKNLIFTNFIVGPSNRFAHDVALAVAKAPADAYNPLFIYSEVGLGKTHLLCAIGNYIKSKKPDVRVVYASSEKFTNELLDYLRLGEMERFRTKYRNVDVLLIDDIQFIGGQEGTQEEFFHTFNSLYNNHKQIVITSDRPPKNIAHLKDRLRSRFEGGLIVNIKPPDLGTRTRILHEKAERDGIYIPEEIINYIASKVKSNVRTLIGILNRVVAHSSLTDRDMDTKLVDEVLDDVLDLKPELPT